MLTTTLHPPLSPTCPTCEQLPLWLNCVMGYWECSEYTADEPFKFWIISDGGQLQEVSGDTYVDDDGSLKVVAPS